MMGTYSIPELWVLACAADGIPPESKFVVFSEDNEWAQRYNRAIGLKMAAERNANAQSRLPA